GHVGVPVLARVGDADRLAVLDDVREIADLGHSRLVVASGQSGLDTAEPPREVSKLHGLEVLTRKAQHAVAAEGPENRCEVRVAQGFREIDASDRRAQDLPARIDGRHRHSSPTLNTAWRDYTAPSSPKCGTGRKPHGDQGRRLPQSPRAL